MFSINHYNNLLATLDSDNQLSIFDLMTKKCPVQINLLSIDPKNEYPELKEFSINGLHFSKNSNFLALSFNEKPFVLLLNLSTANINSKPIFIAYRTAEYYRKVLLDPQNKYLFLECSNSNVYLKYFRDQEFNLKIYEFLVEEKAENSFQIEYITRFCGKKEKNVIILREKTLYIIKYSILKKKQQISEDTINLMMMFEMTYLNSNFVKMVFNQTFDKIIIMGNNKLEAGYYLKYDIEGDTVNSINFSHMKQVQKFITFLI